jgi:signal transduction histidine kinase
VLAAGGWLVGAVVTAGILGTPYLLFGYHSPSLHLVLDSADGCIALLVAYLVHGRFVRTGRLQDTLLAQGLFLLAVAGLGMTLLLEIVPALGPVEVWLTLTLRVVGALLVAAAAVSGRRQAGTRLSRAAPWVVLVVALAVLWLQRDQLPAALAQTPPASAQRPVITGHPLLLTGQAVSAAAFVVASVAFTVQAARRRDPLLRWLGPAFALGAFARVNYVLFPSLYSDWLYTGDLLRTGCYVLLLVGAAREISEHWAGQARTAVVEDRRRLARELHDGVVQELAYIRASARDPGSAEAVVAACDRALDEARAAIDALGHTSAEPLGVVLARAAGQVADRYGGHVAAELDHSVTADDEQRHALVRITREAVSNALRHGRAGRVELAVLRDAHARRLVVRDDGTGFDVAATAGRTAGYGMVSMRERARALPGTLTIDSAPGRGTEVGVEW